MNKFFRLSILLLLAHATAWAETPAVFEASVDKPIGEVYINMVASMDESPFFLIKELNIGRNLSSFADKWGDDYNQNKLSAIRSLVFCNGKYANAVSNLDPAMLAMCPLHLSLIEKDGRTTALFVRPTVIAQGSPAYDLFVEIEQEVIAIIERGLQ